MSFIPTRVHRYINKNSGVKIKNLMPVKTQTLEYNRINFLRPEHEMTKVNGLLAISDHVLY